MVKSRNKPSKNQAFFDVVRADQRRRVERLTERRSVERMKKLYDEASAELEKKLKKIGAASDSFTAHQHRQLLVQVRDGQAQIAARLVNGLNDATRDISVDALQALLDDVHRLEKKFSGADLSLPLDEAGVFRGVVNRERASMLRAHETSFANYGASVVTKIEDELSLSLVTGESFGEAVDRVAKVAETEWWQAERVVRTESIFAINSTQHAGIVEVASDLGDMYIRWVEHVDDSSFMPLDDRVGEDSIAMHGQVVLPGSMFVFPSTMPDGSPVPKECDRYVGESIAFPPLRPNDRATISPWRPHWGIPAWRLVGGRRVTM